MNSKLTQKDGIIDKAIVILGNSKVGKSCILHLMANSNLIGGYNDVDKVVYKLSKDSDLQDVKLGDTERAS